jgi:hypothetical protein
MRMTYIREKDVVGLLNGVGAKLLKTEPDSLAGPLIESRTYYATKPARPSS